MQKENLFIIFAVPYGCVFPEVGQKQKTEKKKERLKVGNNNGQPRIANFTSGGAGKPPGPKFLNYSLFSGDVKNNVNKLNDVSS